MAVCLEHDNAYNSMLGDAGLESEMRIKNKFN